MGPEKAVRVAILIRLQSSDQGTFGLLRTPLGFQACTAELPWRDNARSLSCIPAGAYEAVWTFSPTFRRMMYVLTGTAPREGIRLHAGNLAGDVRRGLKTHFLGCIGLGLGYGFIHGQRAIVRSAPAVLAFQEHMEYEPFRLDIR